jgi:hypothetical protein
MKKSITAAAAQPAKVHQSCSATNYYIISNNNNKNSQSRETNKEKNEGIERE